MAAILHLNDPMAAPRALRFVFVSSNADWGGSEELWSAAAATLVAEGQRVAIYKGGSRDAEPHLRGLRELGCSVYDLKQLLPFPRGLGWRLTWSRTLGHALPLLRLSLGLTLSRRPDLVVISQGGNHDGVFLAELCRRRNLPFVLISHKASALYWPTDFRRDLMRRVFGGARACYFVSEHNRRLTEEQIGMSLAHASIVRNPFLVPWEVREDWPHEGANIRLACIGRLNPLDKGQDLVLRVLGREKWRQRPLFVSFYGSGDKRAGLEGMARHLSLSSVAFEGFSKDPSSIWDRHHGLLLGSRCEGLPLVLVEAMLSGRVPLVTDAGGNGELIEDGVTGFLAAEPSADALDEALERAWQRRAEWRVIGRNAASAVRAKIPREPGRVMAATLKRVAAMEETAPIQDGSATARDQEHHSGRVRAAR